MIKLLVLMNFRTTTNDPKDMVLSISLCSKVGTAVVPVASLDDGEGKWFTLQHAKQGGGGGDAGPQVRLQISQLPPSMCSIVNASLFHVN